MSRLRLLTASAWLAIAADLGANLQAAADMARFRHNEIANVLSLESSLYERVGKALEGMGHIVRSVTGDSVGGVQAIMRATDATAGLKSGARGYYRSGSDFRKDGAAVGW